MPKFNNIFISFTLGAIFSSCGVSVDKSNVIPLEDTFGVTASLVDAASEMPDTTNQYIYDFMKIVIEEQQLNLDYGLEIEPKQRCDLSTEDSVFLQTLLIKKNIKKKSNELNRILISMNELPKCLTRSDVEGMLQQKKRLSKFLWNKSRLGFNLNNNKNWYNISVPLFSKDKSKVVMTIENLCPGLCGTGSTVVFTKKNGKWNSTDGGIWYH